MSDWDARTTHDAAEGPQWVSAAEAADAAGVTPGTVRYWARNGLIVSEVVPGPSGERTLVRLDEVLRHARQQTAAPAAGSRGDAGDVVTDLPARTSELAPILKSIPEIMAQLTAATDRAARAETKVEFLSAQLQDLRRRLAEAEAGRSSSPAATIPEAWETPSETSEPAAPGAAAAAPATPGSSGWPAPPLTGASGGLDWGAATSDVPDEGASEEPKPGAGAIDWGTGSAVPAPEPADDAAPAAAADESQRLTLEELWASPSPKLPVTPPEPPAPPSSDSSDGVDWHAPATGRAEPEEAAPPDAAAPPKRANATVPDEEFYGPRRRRWFRRRR